MVDLSCPSQVCAAGPVRVASSESRDAEALKQPGQLEALRAIESDFENIRRSWDWALEHQQYADLHAMLDGIYLFGLLGNRYRETIALFEQVMRGDVQIQQGVARTDDLSMEGVQAGVHIRGEADIAHETQALSVQVRPDLNAGLASLAYAALVNPVIGLGSFVAQAVLRKPLEQAFTYEYEVKGSWVDPIVTEKRRFQSPIAPSTAASP